LYRDPLEQQGSVQHGAPFGPPSVHDCHISLALYMKYGGKSIPVAEPQNIIDVADLE